ncbi:MAG: hypothetical protein Q8O04_05490 [Deltaproteobacteria bacterium]|nr:hypothetical protein [Deltaproteobacteria bacterium]
MAFLSFRRTPDRGPGQAPESSNFKQIEIPLDTGFHRCDDFCKSLLCIKKDIDPCYYTGYCERLENKKSGRTG